MFLLIVFSIENISYKNALTNPINTWLPSNPGIGSMLKINKNMLILLVRNKMVLFFLSNNFLFNAKAAKSHKIKFTAGPANAIKLPSIGVAFPIMET